MKEFLALVIGGILVWLYFDNEQEQATSAMGGLPAGASGAGASSASACCGCGAQQAPPTTLVPNAPLNGRFLFGAASPNPGYNWYTAPTQYNSEGVPTLPTQSPSPSAPFSGV